MGLLDDMDRRRENRERDRENSARLAHSYAIFKTTGTGVIHHPEPMAFAVTYIERPFVHYGAEIDVDDLANQLDVDDSDDVYLPLTSGYITDWDRDERDFYVGCWVAVRVDFALGTITPPVDVEGNVPDYTEAVPTIQHHFTFSATGLKDVPFDASDGVQ